MNRIACAAVLLCATAHVNLHAQWTIQDGHTIADLRGIDALGNGIAWASGTEGTILRTTNDGKDWQRCATPPDADHLDFRGIQAFDESMAIVMSSGKGPLSRLFQTTDACHTWKLLFTNPDKDGFWDALKFTDRQSGYLLGDPVHGSFFLAETEDGGKHWRQLHPKGLTAEGTLQGVFAASNSSLLLWGGTTQFGSGGSGGASIYAETETTICLDDCPERDLDGNKNRWTRISIPVGHSTETSGVFSLGVRSTSSNGSNRGNVVAIGGDYQKSDEGTNIAAISTDNGMHWAAAQTQPRGFRSSVAYDPTTKTWITVGPNGTDISTDDGRNWRPLLPDPSAGDPPDADQHWNALSLPFVVGPHGRIGKLRPEALPH